MLIGKVTLLTGQEVPQITFASWPWILAGNIPEQQTVARKDRVSCEVNSIGATGAKPPLFAMTTICVGARTG
jgi:hypothetical protein